jgi:hypothetical protein
MNTNEIIQQLLTLENTAPNDFDLGALVREFINQNFKNEKNESQENGGTTNGRI